MTVHLSILLFWPAVLALAGAFLPRRLGGIAALVGSLVPLGYVVVLVGDFRSGSNTLQYVTDEAWIPELGIRYTLGLDGLNLWLVVLTAVLFAAASLWIALRPVPRSRLFAFHFGVAETAVLGALLAQDLALFVLFFDLMLVPVYFLVGQWGEGDRIAATIKLVIYTLVGSLLMLAAAVATGVLVGREADAPLSFALADLAGNDLPETAQNWLFLGFALAFLIKMPAFPFQGWMPDGYRSMPLPVLVFFSGVVSKVAAYGFLRIALPVFPDASVNFQMPLMILALISIIYGSAQAFTQTNTRLILGYSSMAQLGFIVLGIFSLTAEGAQGAILQMINHGLVVAPLFLIIVLLAERSAGSEDIRDMGGLAMRAPVLTGLFLIAAMATLAIPGSANFAGEFLILMGTFESEMAVAFIAAIGVAMASVYMLRMFIRTMHNRGVETAVSRELGVRDAVVIAPLVAAIIAFGLYPQLALEQSEATARQTVRSAQSSLGAPAAASAGAMRDAAGLQPATGEKQP
jgi:NADH-quinone oxidoreductase subunit M